MLNTTLMNTTNISSRDVELDPNLIKSEDQTGVKYKHSPQIPYIKKLKKDFQRFYGNRSEHFILELDLTTSRGRTLLNMIRNIVKHHNYKNSNRKTVYLEGTSAIEPSGFTKTKTGKLKQIIRDENSHIIGGIQNCKTVSVYVYDNFNYNKRIPIDA